MTAKVAFKQDDLKRAVAGCIGGGMSVGSVRIAPDGSIEVYSAEATSAPRVNKLDEKVFGAS